MRSASIRSINAANRYPEFLPERLLRLIAGNIGLPADQVVLGAGATGVVLQALQVLTTAGGRNSRRGNHLRRLSDHRSDGAADPGDFFSQQAWLQLPR